MNSIELFSGTGGLALGLQLAGFDHKALFEWDKASCENIKENIANGYPGVRDWKVYQTDVRTVNYNGYTGSIQLVAGGPPCQPFSLGGKHQAYNDKRDMFPEAVRAVRETQPEAFIFENVKGLLRKSFSSYFNYILLQLQHPEIVKKENMTWEEHMSLLEKHHTAGHDDGLSYNVVFRLLNAADYGVPQSRHRVIIVGFRSDSNISWSFPNATHSQEALLYSKWVTGDYWREHDIKKPSEMPRCLPHNYVQYAVLLRKRIHRCRDGRLCVMRLETCLIPLIHMGLALTITMSSEMVPGFMQGIQAVKWTNLPRPSRLAHTVCQAVKIWLCWTMAVSATIQFEKVRGYKLSRMIISLVHPGLRV